MAGKPLPSEGAAHLANQGGDAGKASPGVSFSQVRAFLAVAEHRSITLAAQQLHLTQSGLSRVIHELEVVLGVSIFERKPHGMALTPAGAAFLPYARQLAHTYADAITSLRMSGRRNFKFAASNVILPHVVSGLLGSTRGDLSLEEMTVEEISSHLVIDSVASGKADVGLCLLAGATHEDVECIPLLRLPLGLLAGIGMPLPPNVQSLDDIMSLPWARLTDDMVLPRTLRLNGIKFDAYFSSRIVSNSMPALFSTVANGRLVTLVSSISAYDASMRQTRQMQFVPLPHLLPSLTLCLVGRKISGWQASYAVWLDAIQASVSSVAWPGAEKL